MFRHAWLTRGVTSRSAALLALDALPAGVRVPAETDRHERTLIAWPTETRRQALWGNQLAAARDVHAQIARAIADFEPVLLIADPEDADDAARQVGGAVEVLAEPIDDSWIRDSGPVIATAPDGSRHAISFRFTGWGGSFTPFDRDATIAGRVAAYLGIPAYEIPLAAEGGALALDGAGTVVTTERCLLNPNRNPDVARSDIDALLRRALGANEVVWLADGIAEDEGTDGHVDNVVAFVAPGHCVLQGCDETGNPNGAIARANRTGLERAGIGVTEVPVLPYAEVDGAKLPVPYVNLYAVNGAVIVPTTGHPADERVLDLIGQSYSGREVVAVPGAVLAYGGGGPHCITQQVPA
jgi:agmatine deiminase